MYCHQCGTEAVDDAVFCHSCGTKLIGDTDGRDKPQPRYTRTAEASSPQSAGPTISDVMQRSDVGLGKAKHETKTEQKHPSKLLRLAQATTIAMPLHFVGGWIFSLSEGVYFNPWDQITGILVLGYMLFPFALGYWILSNSKKDSKEAVER